MSNIHKAQAIWIYNNLMNNGSQKGGLGTEFFI